MLRRGSPARRAVLCAGLGFALAAVWPLADHARGSQDRTLSMYNIHTKETISITFKRDGRYDTAALKRLNEFMRDWRRNESTSMDPELVDLIWELHRSLGSKEPVHLISGYRSPATNEALRRTRGGQAKHSQHMLGKAADIHFPDVSVKALRNSALVREVGGVGYYPTSAIPFVHVDTARVRSWPRLPREELALLFPSGRTQHLPADGRPLTKKDVQVAMAKLKARGETYVAAATLPPEPEPATAMEAPLPKPILASFAPGPAVRPQPGVAADPARAPAEAEPRFLMARATGDDPIAALLSLGRMPALYETAYETAEVAHAPEVDDDHPDELSYVPFPIDPLMTDASVVYDRELATLSHPDQSSFDHLFENLDRPMPAQFGSSLRFASLSDSQRFAGQAIRNLYLEMGTQGPAQYAQGPLLSRQ